MWAVRKDDTWGREQKIVLAYALVINDACGTADHTLQIDKERSRWTRRFEDTIAAEFYLVGVTDFLDLILLQVCPQPAQESALFASESLNNSI
jgi:hypothetical protein